ncbi:lysozyme inhibitor LprI family protein [Phenylobacterium sp.]|uniref:lysozyme inhibitor LprI family protein n=1 Tax=Phenylobacterium sp. TaxID=1871053 RepID=UPI002735B63F|nr:lysozyme inhibitor LprI family protein [Phenylobacterium sp.]MDP3852173.1 lysozyme inhibitor LprI family protein [Phenylobacterium sp.]
MTFDDEEERPLVWDAIQGPPRPKPRLGGKALAGGVAIACVLGLGLGLAARPDLISRAEKPAAMQPRPGTAEGQIDIVMADPRPVPPVRKSAPLETMSPDLIQAAPKPPPPLPVVDPEAPRQTPPRAAPDAGVDASVRAPDPARVVRPSFDCRRARSPAEDMICADPDLAAADRRLARAFQRALQAGTPYDLLRAEQDDWLEIREDAARRSSRAVAAVYGQRIAELDAMADDAGRDWEN